MPFELSIIIPVYNVESYLRECLDSVIKQTCRDFQIICVDDGSTDGSRKILNEYALSDKRITVITQKNSGLSAARNTGMAAASGKYYIFLDSDDYINPNLIENIFKIIQKYSPEFICYGSKAFGNNGHTDLEKINKYLDIKYKEGEATLTFEMMRNTNIHAWNKVYLASKIKENKLNFIKGLYYEDIFFVWAYAFLTRKVYFDPQIYHNYRLRSDSIMGSTYAATPLKIMDHLINWHELFKYFKKKSIYGEIQPYLTELFNHYSRQTLAMVRKEDVPKVNKLKKKYAKELKECGIKSKKSRYLKKIFSIKTNREKTHKILTILGLKIKFKIPDKVIIKEMKAAMKYATASCGSKSIGEDFVKRTNNAGGKIQAKLDQLKVFHFLPNRGNLGDIAIACAEFQLFDVNGYNYETLDINMASSLNGPFHLVYGGGGLWVDCYRRFYKDILELFSLKNAERIVIMPSSFHNCDDAVMAFDDRFTVFCREKRSYAYCQRINDKAEFILADDMALGLNLDFYRNNFSNKNHLNKYISQGTSAILEMKNSIYQYYIETYNTLLARIDTQENPFDIKTAYFLRTDQEKVLDWKKCDLTPTIDLSLVANSFACDKSLDFILAKLFLAAIDEYDCIVTDRLHIGICAMLLDKDVLLFDNLTKKCSGVLESSIKKTNIRLVDIASLKEEIAKIHSMNVKRPSSKTLRLMPDNFIDFLLLYGSIENRFGCERKYWRERNV